MSEEAIFQLDQSGWRDGSHDGLTVYPDRVVIDQRTTGKGDISIPREQITEVKAEGRAGFMHMNKRGYSLNLRAGSKKYVIRRLTREEAEGAAAVLNDS